MTRKILEISGADAEKFLADLITNTLPEDGGISYAALLSPQGKYLFDFFVLRRGDVLWVDVDESQAAALGRRLMMYRLRADVQIEALDTVVAFGVSDRPETALDDPRDSRLAWRDYSGALGQDVDLDALRVDAIVPEGGAELISDDSYILEMGFERLNGVDFKKGCYVGQEVTARMKHKTELRKGLARVALSQEVPSGTELTAGGKPVGTVYTQSNGKGLAYLRFDRAKGEMRAAEASVTLDETA